MVEPKESLVIANFAGINSLEIEVSPLTVLIGPQSVGKSVTAKLLYFFRCIPRFLLEQAYSDKLSTPEDILTEKFKMFFPTSAPPQKTCALIYKQGQALIQIERATVKSASWQIYLPEQIEDAFYKLRDRLLSFSDFNSVQVGAAPTEGGARVEYSNAVYDVLPYSTAYSRFIPAGRSFYAQVQTDMAAFFRSASLNPFVTEFGVYLARLRKRSASESDKQLDSRGTNAKLLSRQLLSGDYVRAGNEDFIRTSEERVLPALIWSSGQQEAQPLTSVLRYHCEQPIATGSLFVEEPEAHLFPVSQRTMTELIALAFNTHWPDSRIFITTHSPYILTTINNLLLAGQIYATTPSSEITNRLADLLPADRALAPGSVGAFYMDQNSCRYIMDEETGLINASAIDDVSADINEKFEALLDLQYHP